MVAPRPLLLFLALLKTPGSVRILKASSTLRDKHVCSPTTTPVSPQIQVSHISPPFISISTYVLSEKHIFIKHAKILLRTRSREQPSIHFNQLKLRPGAACVRCSVLSLWQQYLQQFQKYWQCQTRIQN